ncbi:MAG TPA: PAS domain-containing protein, partial [Actinomycetota bacterium]
MDTARRIEDDLRHAPVLEAVADAVERLLSASDWRPAAAAALERLGSAAGASRAYLIENHIDERGMLVGSTQHAWSSTVGGRPPSDVEDERAWQGALKRWAGLHAMGSVVVADVANLPDDERVELESRGVCSVAEYPILTGAAWWGVIGFEDHERDRSWRNELEALRTIASVIGAVVARDRATEEHRRTERRWQQVIEHIPAITYTDLVVAPGQVRMGFVSPQIQTVLGYEPQRFLEDPKLWLSLVHPDDLARLEASGVLEPSDTSAFDEIYRMRAADGSYRWLHDTSTPVVNGHGEFDHFLGFAIDVTERMQAQEFVRQAEERYRLLVERTPVITYTEDIAEVYEPEATVSYVSPQITAILGYDARDWQEPGFWM